MGTRTLLDRLDAALATCAVKLWSELLAALAVAGQFAAGTRCFPPDPPSVGERSARLDRASHKVNERATSFGLPAGLATHAMADPGCAPGIAAANGPRAVLAEEAARVSPDDPGTALQGAGCCRFYPAPLGCEVAAGGVFNGAAHWGPGLSNDREAGVVPSNAH